MLNDTPFYNQTIRNTIVAFGRMFSNIKIQRRNSEGVIEQTIQVPIAYSQKEKWVQSNETNPDHERGIYAALPRMGFEILGYNYDSSRKLPRMNRIHCTDENGRKQVFSPVPYNLDLSLYFVTKTQEDGLQILEQILPTFSPEYTVTVKSIPELQLMQDVPFILNSVAVQDDYEGDLSVRRFVTHTLTFTAKINLFSAVSEVGVIKRTETTVATPGSSQQHIAEQNDPSDPIQEEWIRDF